MDEGGDGLGELALGGLGQAGSGVFQGLLDGVGEVGDAHGWLSKRVREVFILTQKQNRRVLSWEIIALACHAPP